MFQGAFRLIETGTGDVYFDGPNLPTRKLSGDRIEDFPVGNFRADDGVFVNRGVVRAINDRGQMVWEAGTDSNHTRLYFAENGRNTQLATNSLDRRWQLPAPSGGTVSGWGEVAIDELGRAMINLQITGGPSGWFLWDNGRWRQTAVYPNTATTPSPTTAVKGQVFTGSNNLRAMNDKFYAVFPLRAGGSALAEFRDTEWTWIAGSLDPAPYGNTINNIGAYEVNRQGDIAFAINGGQLLVSRSGGQDRMVYFNVEAPDAGDFFSVQNVELREDGRIYFAGINQLDQYELWLAEPLLTTPPPRSRRAR